MEVIDLRGLLDAVTKAQLQAFYLHWFPGRDLVSSKDRLRSELSGAMTDFRIVRERFDTLSRSQRAFLSALLTRQDSFSASVEEVRSDDRGRSIEDYEVESLLKSLQEAGYIAAFWRDGSDTVFGIPGELGKALRATIALEDRGPAQMLDSGAEDGSGNARSLRDEVAALGDPRLRRLTESAIDEHCGILTLSVARNVESEVSDGDELIDLDRAEWRTALEEAGIGTTGVLSLKSYGLDIEEEALIVYQDRMYQECFTRSSFDAVEATLAESELDAESAENDVEISLGSDLLIDLERLPELLKGEKNYLTRQNKVYKKVEERLGKSLMISQNSEFVDGAPVQHLFDLSKRLRFIEVDAQVASINALRFRIWTKNSLEQKVRQVFQIYRAKERGARWSFHQEGLRDFFLEEIQQRSPGSWMLARPFLVGVVARYLKGLEANGVRAEFEALLNSSTRHRRLVVSLPSLLRDLSYWVLHRVALLGLIDVGYRGGRFQSFRVSRLGFRFLGLSPRPEFSDSPRMLVNPDFEILMYPEAPEDWTWQVSRFADRVDSDYVKRYQMTRESIKRGIVSGLERESIVEFLRQSAHGSLPENIVFSLREWTEGMEIVSKQKVLLLRAQSPTGLERMEELLERSDVPFERLNDSSIAVRGAKYERRLKELDREFRDWGLIVE